MLKSLEELIGSYFKIFYIEMDCNLNYENQRFLRDGDKMAPSVEKTMVELEMGLLHLQQNIDIPEVTLTINPIVLAMIGKCAEENRKPKVSDFGALVEDSKFLNQLQAGVNRWIKEIQKVKL